ncbi:MAG TPA: bifunctional pyr operon transcriptional regulator/uracil phosphoribosyltransferase PyrR [Polyangiaceae bacterium]
MRVLVDAEAVSRGLRRVAVEILERHRGTSGLMLVGVRRGGVTIARAIQDSIRELEGQELPMGSVDITFYRDDAATALPNPRIGPSEMPGPVDEARVILVDDVLYTGRTIRAAIDAIMDYGRPSCIELAVLVDRGGRELPIEANYVVRRVDVGAGERVDVVSDESGLVACVQPLAAPTIPPTDHV